MADGNPGLEQAQATAQQKFDAAQALAQPVTEERAMRDRLWAAWNQIYVHTGRSCDHPINYRGWSDNLNSFCETVRREAVTCEGLVDRFLEAQSPNHDEQVALDLLRAGLQDGEQGIGRELAKLARNDNRDWMKVFDANDLLYRVFDPKRAHMRNFEFRFGYARKNLPEVLKVGNALVAVIASHNARLDTGAPTQSVETANQLLDELSRLCKLVAPLWVESRLPHAQGPRYAIAVGPDSGVPMPINQIVRAVLDLLDELGCVLPRFAGDKVIGPFGFAPPGFLKSHNLLRSAVDQFLPCPKCGEPLWPDEADRLCPACRQHGEMCRFIVALQAESTIEEQRIPNAATLKQLACKLFGHTGFTGYHHSEPRNDGERSTTLARLEQWLDAKFQQRGEEQHPARERWLAKNTAQVLDLIQVELDGQASVADTSVPIIKAAIGAALDAWIDGHAIIVAAINALLAEKGTGLQIAAKSPPVGVTPLSCRRRLAQAFRDIPLHISNWPAGDDDHWCPWSVGYINDKTNPPFFVCVNYPFGPTDTLEQVIKFLQDKPPNWPWQENVVDPIERDAQESHRRFDEMVARLDSVARQAKGRSNLPPGINDGQPILSGLIATGEIARLAMVKQNTLRTALSEARKSDDPNARPPEPSIKGTGRQQARYSYVEIRPWLLRAFAAKKMRFPESFEEVKRILAASPKVSND